MLFPNPKIKFYKIRTFGEKFNIAFDFLRETWKPLIKFSLYLILPICLIQAFAMNAYMRFAFSMGSNSYYGEPMEFFFSVLPNVGIFMLCTLIGSSLLSSLIYTLMQEYERRENRLQDITLADFKNILIRNFGKALQIALFLFAAYCLCAVIIVLLAFLSLWTLVVTIPIFLIGLFIIAMPISIFTPLYIFEDQPFFVALRRSFKYGFSAWGEIFLILLIFYLLGSIINTVTTMPWYIMVLIQSFFTLADEGNAITSSWWYEFIMYLLGIVQSYGTYLSVIISLVGLAFQYFHTREKKEGISVKESIANFNEL